jgi:hypothetical protein
MAPFGGLIADASRISAPYTLMIGVGVCILGAALFSSKLRRLRQLVHPIYVRIGIIPKLVRGIHAAPVLQYPPKTSRSGLDA